MNLHNATDALISSRRGQGRTKKTLRYYRDHCERFTKWCESNGYEGSDLEGLTCAELIEEFMTMRRDSGKAAATISADYRALRSLYNFAESRAMCDENPFRYLSQPKRERRLPKAIDEDSYYRLVASIDTGHWTGYRDQLLIKMLGTVGLRAGELVALDFDGVDLDGRLLQVYRSKVSEEGFAAMPYSTATMLREWIEDVRPKESPHLWPTSDGGNHISQGPLRAEGLTQMCKRRCLAAGLQKIWRPHSFRHRVGVQIVIRLGSLKLVQMQLGHKDISTSEIYARFDTAEQGRLLDRVFE